MTLTQTISRSGVLSLVAVVMVRATWFCVRKYRPTNGELFLAYIALVLALVFFIVGCLTSPVGSSPAIKSAATPNIVVAPVRTITLVWNPNYTVAGEATEIFESTDLTIPMSEWPVVFEGATNRCSLPMTGAQEFFIAANLLIL